jgi:AraC-like DNA-binding protein
MLRTKDLGRRSTFLDRGRAERRACRGSRDVFHFSRAFKQRFTVTPREWRKELLVQ